MILPSEYVYTGAGVLVVTVATGAAVVPIARGAAGAGTAVVDTAWVTGCAGAEEVHPVKSVASNNSPHTILMLIIWFLSKDFFMLIVPLHTTLWEIYKISFVILIRN